jgi:hypothetical protein
MIVGNNWRKKFSKKIEDIKENTLRLEEKAREKRKEKNKIKQELKPETPSFKDCYTQSTVDKSAGDNRQSKENKVNWFCVQRWFIKGIRKNNPDWLVIDNEKTKKWTERKQTWWTWAEKNCAQRLLDHYGENVVRETVEWFCDNWQGMVDESNGRLSGAPSVKLLWASRDRIFVDAKLGYVPGKRNKKKKKHMVGEYDPELDGSTKVGW